MKCASRTSSITPRNRSSRSVANLRKGSVISIWRPVISTLISDPHAGTRSVSAVARSLNLRSGPEATLMSTWNFQIFPILCNAAACNGNTFLFQHLGNLPAGHRLPPTSFPDDFLPLTLTNQQRRPVPHRTINCPGEKEPQPNHTLSLSSQFLA